VMVRNERGNSPLPGRGSAQGTLTRWKRNSVRGMHRSDAPVPTYPRSVRREATSACSPLRRRSTPWLPRPAPQAAATGAGWASLMGCPPVGRRPPIHRASRTTFTRTGGRRMRSRPRAALDRPRWPRLAMLEGRQRLRRRLEGRRPQAVAHRRRGATSRPDGWRRRMERAGSTFGTRTRARRPGSDQGPPGRRAHRRQVAS
jgi:hypothetical protein